MQVQDTATARTTLNEELRGAPQWGLRYQRIVVATAPRGSTLQLILLMLSLSIASLALQMPHSELHDLPFDDLVDNDKDPLCYKFCPTRMNSSARRCAT